MIRFEDCDHGSSTDHEPADRGVGINNEYWHCNTCGAEAFGSHVERESDEEGYITAFLVIEWEPAAEYDDEDGE